MSELSTAIKQICEEKGLDEKSVIATIESALAAAYRKDFGEKNQNIKVEFDPETGGAKIFDVKTVVEDLPLEEIAGAEDAEEGGLEKKPTEVLSFEPAAEEEKKKFNPRTDIQLSGAKVIKKTAKIGDEIKTKLEIPNAYGRMAAQTAKQVIVQRLREAEREMIFEEFKGKEKEVVSGVIQRREGRIVLIDLGKAAGYLPAEEQIFGEEYKPGERIKVYIKEVKFGSRGPEIILSRTSEEILRKVFYLEIPEISNGLIEMKAVARESGSRSKVAVWTNSENVDPIGSCVGQRGARIQTIIGELGGEKIDIIEYNENINKFVANALSPAKILSVEIKAEERKAVVKVLPDQLSLAIGKNGQNARLAARLTGWRIDIIEAKDVETYNHASHEDSSGKNKNAPDKNASDKEENPPVEAHEHTSKHKNALEKEKETKKKKKEKEKTEKKPKKEDK